MYYVLIEMKTIHGIVSKTSVYHYYKTLNEIIGEGFKFFVGSL